MFFYLKPTSWSPKEELIYAIKVGGELHPCTYQSDAKKGKYESFIRGTGWKKSKKVYQVPVYKGTTKEEWEAYLNEHGKYCLFYSITGKQLGDDDCVIWGAKQEFHVAIGVGYEYMANFLTKINALNAKIQKIVLEKHNVDIFSDRMQWNGGKPTDDGWIISQGNLFVVKPCYSLMAYFLTKPHIDPIVDDQKLWKHFVSIVGAKNIDEGEHKEKEFPVSVRDRLTYLFSKEVSDEYAAIMKEFPLG